MAQTYNTLEGDLTIKGAATTARTGETNAVAIVGGYDSANADGSVTAGESTAIDDPANAADTFGTAEIPRVAQLVSANGVGTMYGVPAPETSTTESFSASSSLTLTNTPVMDPSVHPDHEIVVTDTSSATDLTVNITYADSPSTPSSSDTANVNPINGKVECDSSSDYDVDYTYGDYSTAIDAAADLNVRSLVVCTESPSVKASLSTTLGDIADDFDFKRAYVGAKPNIEAGSIGSYTPDEQNWRIVEVAPARCEGADGEVRTAGAVGGFMSSQPISPDGSGLYDDVNGIVSLDTEYRASEVKDFDGVTALTRTGTIGTAQTTSTTEQFKHIYATEIIDKVALGLFGTAESYAGGPQDTEELETLLEIQCQRFSTGTPPLLGFGDGSDGDPYDVNVSLGQTNGVADAGVVIVPYPIAETVNLSITVSDGFVEFGGANA